MSDVPRLPASWCWTTIGSLVDSYRNGFGRRPKGIEGGPIVLRLADVAAGTVDLSTPRRVSMSDEELSLYGLKSGDALFVRVNGSSQNIGRCIPVTTYQEMLAFNDHLIRARLVPGMDAKYLALACNLEQAQRFIVGRAATTAGQLTVNQTAISEIPIPLAPLTEQRRIVAAIEEQFTRLDAGVAALKRAQAALKRYRAAVLKAAVEGRLTEAWRAAHPDVEPASELLGRILAEQRAKWEADLREKGKDPAKARYEEPKAPQTKGLPELPQGWVWVTVNALLTDIQAGKNFQCEERPPNADEVGVVKVSAVTWGEYDEDESKTCMNPELVKLSLLVEPGDFLFSRANTIALVGACVIAKRVTRQVMLSDKILRMTFCGNQEWVLWALRSMQGRAEIERLATGNQESMRNISQDNIRRIRIPLPPKAEQETIVAEVERRLSVVGVLEATIAANLKRVERLRQAILERAFTGRLVPQDPDDESASALLERVLKEREISKDSRHGEHVARPQEVSAIGGGLWAEP